MKDQTEKKLYIIAESSDKLSQKFINFNLSAALKSGWLKEVIITGDQLKLLNE